VFYSGYLAVTFILLVQVQENLRQSARSRGGGAPSLLMLVRESLPGNRWLQAIPTGYEPSIMGLAIFGVSGIGDLTWHCSPALLRASQLLMHHQEWRRAIIRGEVCTGSASFSSLAKWQLRSCPCLVAISARSGFFS